MLNRPAGTSNVKAFSGTGRSLRDNPSTISRSSFEDKIQNLDEV